jgi:riboflavin synthase
MFTGIVQATGRIARIEMKGGDKRLTIATAKLPLASAAIGDSVAVNGVCLTAVELGERHFSADASRETLSRTTLGDACDHMLVNLELALTPTTRLGGHIVSGHVDGVGRILEKRDDARSVRLQVEAPAVLARYIAEKGSICIDGVSLTVNQVHGAWFDVNIVPHTLNETTLGEARVGQKVNLEVDLLARYLERLLLGEKASEVEGVSKEFLRPSGPVQD